MEKSVVVNNIMTCDEILDQAVGFYKDAATLKEKIGEIFDLNPKCIPFGFEVFDVIFQGRVNKRVVFSIDGIVVFLKKQIPDA